MRRSVFTPVFPLALGALALAGCEDGPNQTFQPAPANAASVYNSEGQQDAGAVDPGSQGFDAGSSGTNAVNICTPAEQNAAWSTAFLKPMMLPFEMGGLDLSTGGTFAPFTIEMAEHGVTNGANGFDVAEALPG